MKNRATGRTTRIVDEAIQELFTTGECFVLDHYSDGYGFKDEYALRLTYNRLMAEHGHMKDRIVVDGVNCKISIKDFKEVERVVR